MNITPAFNDVMQRYMQAVEQYGHEPPTCAYLFSEMVEVAPPEFMDLMSDTAKEMDLMPEPRYTEDGEAVYSLDEVAKRCGVSPDEAQQHLDELMQATGRESRTYESIETLARN